MNVFTIDSDDNILLLPVHSAPHADPRRNCAGHCEARGTLAQPAPITLPGREIVFSANSSPSSAQSA